MKVNPESIARASSRHPWRTIVAWVVLLITALVVVIAGLSNVLTNDISFTNKPESIKAQDVMDQKFGGKAQDNAEYVIVQSSSVTTSDPAFQAYVKSLQGVLAGSSGILASPPVTYYDIVTKSPDQAAGLVSKDQHAMLIPVTLVDSEDATADGLRDLVVAHADPAFTTQVAGQASLNADFTRVAEEDARKGESIGIAVALIVLVVVFAAILAAVVPIMMAVFAIVVALGLVTGIGQIVHFNLFVTNMISMIGLAVGIDYSLFIVSRFREERKKGFDKLEAIGASGATANRAVFFSGMTVVLALLGMFIIPTTIFRSLAAGAILVTLAAIAASMTLLPAFLALLGDRAEPRGNRLDWPWLSRIASAVVFFALLAFAAIVGVVLGVVGAPAPVVLLGVVAALVGSVVWVTRKMKRGSWSLVRRFTRDGEGDPDPRGGVWDRLARGVMARPWVFLISGVLVLGYLASFYLQLNKGSSTDINQLPDVPSKAAFLTLQNEFAGGLADPIQIIVTGDVQSAQSGIATVRQDIKSSAAFSPNTTLTTSQDGTAAEISAYLQGTTQGVAAFQAVEDLRNDIVPSAFAGTPNVQVYVGGNTAIFDDFLHQTDQYQWIVLAFVLGLSFCLLTVVFRSIVVPVKAILLNLLSVGAAYGAITLVFQKGVGIGFFNAIGFNFHQSPAVEAWLPLFLFSVLFGLSMDYEVFLLSRIREEYDKTHDNTEAVAYGLRTTAGIITGAAIIMVVVFIGFASGRLGPLQQMGFGLAVAVFMDATIVRVLLVPASMRLLGDRNWYLPKWLEWLPKLNVEGHEPSMLTIPDTPAELVEARDSND
jgi:putative drug exporter of the RND superfamily